MVVVGLLAVAAAGLGVGVRSTEGGHAAVDEPQYLLTALSLAEDGDLDIADELGDERWRDFHDRDLPVQTEPLPGGRQLSPHDPLLPLLLAGPVAVGGWVAAKAALALLAGVLAALTLWLAVRRFGVPLPIAAPGVALAACSAPLAVYGQQVYPELPAALATTVGVAALTAPALGNPIGSEQGRRWRPLATLVGAVVALPWLSVKYVPVAAALAAVGLVTLWRAGHRRALLAVGAALAGAGLAYLAVHRLVWGGWTVYASGDHFQRGGEFGVVGFDPNYPGRSIRLLGLLADRDFGLAAWQPAWLLAVPALAALLAVRPRGWAALAAPLAAAWCTATFVAVTMHGFWWPGRQVVVVLPLAVVAILWWLSRLRARWALAAGLAALVGVGYYALLLGTGLAGDTTWVHAPDRTDLHQPMAWLLPDNREQDAGDHALLGLYTVVALAVAAAAWLSGWRGRSTGRPAGRPPAAYRT
jgi:hypothetical protein